MAASKKKLFNFKDPATVIALIAFTLAGAALIRTSFAARPIRGSTSGTCAVSPAVVTPGQDYVISGSGLGAYTLVNVLVADSGGTTAYNVQADANGATSFTGRSYATGTDSVTFKTSGTKKTAVLASCAFQVQ